MLLNLKETGIANRGDASNSFRCCLRVQARSYPTSNASKALIKIFLKSGNNSRKTARRCTSDLSFKNGLIFSIRVVVTKPGNIMFHSYTPFIDCVKDCRSSLAFHVMEDVAADEDRDRSSQVVTMTVHY